MGDAAALLLEGGMAFLDDDFAGARKAWEAAYRLLRDAGRRREAARAAIDLTELHADILGNHAAARGWESRARRLLDAEGPCVEWGYLELARIACEWHDVFALEAAADRALAIALEHGDSDLEVRALADGGFALVAQGRTEEGFARLDEAMAALTAGEVENVGVAAQAFCALLSACDAAGSVQRAEEWTRLTTELLLERYDGRPKVLHGHCRLAYGSVLVAAGRWSDGEAELLGVASATASRGHRSEAAARLAQMRVLQGRLDEAADLLAPYEDRVAACEPLARLHLARNEHDLAAAAAQRGLDLLVGDRLREGALLSVLVEIELGRDLDRAAAAAERLGVVAAACTTPILHALAALADGQVVAASGDPEAAVARLTDALRILGETDRPALAGRISAERARALAAAGDTAAAIAEARAALAVFERLGAQPDVDRTAALLRSLGAPTRMRTRPAGDAVAGLTSREADVLDLLREGLTNAEIGARLFISAKTAEHHVGRVLAKLGVRSRAEAAAVAAAARSGSA